MSRRPKVLSQGAHVLVILSALLTAAWAEDEFAKAARLESSGEYEAAIAEYESFLSNNPQDRLAPLAAMTVANIQNLALENTEAAIIGYDRVLKEYGQSEWASEAARRKGECLQSSEQWEAAATAYGLALTLVGQAPDISTNWVNEVSLAAADCYYELGDRSQVIETYEQALERSLPPHSEASILYRLADSYEANSQLEKAAASYARIIEEYPFAQVFDQAMGKQELVQQYEDIAWEPYLTYHQTAADFRNRQFLEAIPKCTEVLTTSQNPLLRQCAEYRRIVAQTTTDGDFTRGSAELDSLLGSIEDRRTMPNAEQQLQRFQQVADLEALAQNEPENVTHLRTLGGMYLQFRSTEKAVGTLEKAKSLGEEDPQLSLLLGYGYAQAGRGEEAAQAFGEYLTENPNDANTLNMIGYTYLGLGDTETAITYFRRYVEAAPDDANAHDSLGEGLLRAGRLEEAAAEYEQAVAMDSSFSNSYFMLGDIYRQQGEIGKAKWAYEEFLGLIPAGGQAEQARAALGELDAGDN
jgi:tetratricopeptide (TPR) repeat protein